MTVWVMIACDGKDTTRPVFVFSDKTKAEKYMQMYVEVTNKHCYLLPFTLL